MTLSISLSPEVEDKLKELATAEGQDPTLFASKLLEDAVARSAHQIPQTTQRRDQSDAAAFFASWAAADDTFDPDEIARRNQEVEAFKREINRNRKDSEGADSKIPFP